ncbi:hypothetical protein GCM10009665_56290 [Kitasatospora nipponensis]|uniref:Beta-ketoacyl synthase-like protein n=1 Tax=Kitasatospora nipponensis TaxID=258049 RepID=A0ABP4HD98_9ACTN
MTGSLRSAEPALLTGLGVRSAARLVPVPVSSTKAVHGAPRPLRSRYALSVNCAFGGANTALLVGAP